LTNVSSDVEFCPLDPWFDRNYKENAQKLNMPFTQLWVGNKRFIGGPAINDGTKRETLQIDTLDEDLKPGADKQLKQNALRKLFPGQKMVTFLATDHEDEVPGIAKGFAGPMVYRVRLRNGLATIRGRELSTTSLIGVEFTNQDIKDLKNGP